MSDPLAHFTPQVREWFNRAFAAPTPAQEQAWPAIASGEHVLISPPTGSGKTLAAFLCGILRLACDPLPARERSTLVVYVPLPNSLDNHIKPNLRPPLLTIGT